MPISTPPCTWLSISFGFIGRPQSCTATTRSTRIAPVSVSTDTSANCTPPRSLLRRVGIAHAAAEPAIVVAAGLRSR